MTEQILLMNPRKGRMPPGLARYWARHGRGRKRRRKAHARTRVRASNPRPRRRRRIHYRRRARRANPIMRRRHHYVRRRRRASNPRLSLRGVQHQVMSTVVPAAIGGVGAVGLDLAWGYGASYLPAQMQTGWGATVSKLGAALLIGYGLARFTPVSKKAVASGVLGAVTVIAYQTIRDFAKKTFPDVKGFGGYADYVDYSLMADRRLGDVAAYMPGGRPSLGFVNPAPLLDQANMGAYMPDSMASFHGYVDDGM
jgi:hypothetical protein